MVNQGIDIAEKFQCLHRALFIGKIAIDVRCVGGFREEGIGGDAVHGEIELTDRSPQSIRRLAYQRLFRFDRIVGNNMGKPSVQKQKYDQRREKDKDQMGDHKLVFKFHVVQEIVHGGLQLFFHGKAPL